MFGSIWCKPRSLGEQRPPNKKNEIKNTKHIRRRARRLFPSGRGSSNPLRTRRHSVCSAFLRFCVSVKRREFCSWNLPQGPPAPLWELPGIKHVDLRVAAATWAHSWQVQSRAGMSWHVTLQSACCGCQGLSGPHWEKSPTQGPRAVSQSVRTEVQRELCIYWWYNSLGKLNMVLSVLVGEKDPEKTG